MSDLPNDQGQDKSNPKSNERGQAPGTTTFIQTALLRGAEEARREAESGVPRIKAAALEAAYQMAYGLSFAGVFVWTVGKNLPPAVLDSGCRDGAKAGREMASRWTNWVRNHNKPKEPALLMAPTRPATDTNPG